MPGEIIGNMRILDQYWDTDGTLNIVWEDVVKDAPDKGKEDVKEKPAEEKRVAKEDQEEYR